MHACVHMDEVPEHMNLHVVNSGYFIYPDYSQEHPGSGSWLLRLQDIMSACICMPLYSLQLHSKPFIQGTTLPVSTVYSLKYCDYSVIIYDILYKNGPVIKEKHHLEIHKEHHFIKDSQKSYL